MQQFGHALPEFCEGMPYGLYLDTWQRRGRIRNLAFRKYGQACQVCKGTTHQLHVHHRTHEHLYHEDKHLGDLAVLCNCATSGTMRA
jgi:hypothetical protein